MKKFLFILVAALTMFASGAYASKAVTRPINVTLQDGRQVTVFLHGDEHFSFYSTASGELIIRDGNTWHAANTDEIQIAEKAYKKAVQLRTGEAISGTKCFPHFGNPKALVILASFSDRDFSFTREDVDTLFNSTEYNSESGVRSYSSLAQYMNDCSEGQFRPEFDVFGPYKLPEASTYYGKNSGNTKDIYVSQLIKDACTAADSDVDFSQYDADGDGYVDLVYVVYAGFGENFGAGDDLLWPKSGYASGVYDGVTLNRYGINNELLGDENTTDKDGNKPLLSGIGVLTHEFCHTLGLPDVYPTANWSDVTKYDNQSMEYWDLMDGGENNYNGICPTPLTAFERELFGWMKIDTLSEAANVEMLPLQDGGKAYRIMNDNDATGNEYYILEDIPNGKGSGWYRRMRGTGLLVTHIDYNSSSFSNFNCPNNVQGHPRWTIVPADSIIMSSYRHNLAEDDESYISPQDYYDDMAGDTYPGTSNVTELIDYKAYTGTVEKPITEIAQDGYTIRFKFMGGVDGIVNIMANADSDTNAVYNLQGQKVGADYKGIIIKNGKKYLNK